MMNNCYIVAGPDIVFEKFGGDLVVLDIATGRYFGFNHGRSGLGSPYGRPALQPSRNWDSMLPRSAGSLKTCGLQVDRVRHGFQQVAAGPTARLPGR